MKEIVLTQNKVAVVSDQDFEWLNRWKWQYGSDGYARRTALAGGKQILLAMHRQITGCPKGLEVDHINRVRLDNRRENLRIVTRKQNSHNLGIRKNNTSGVAGVYWDKRKNKWKVHIMVDGKKMHLGYSKLLYVAAKIRKAADKKYGFVTPERRSSVPDLNR